ncbi:MAG: sialidase family protein [Gemmatimonadales bacterium]
MRRPAIVLVGVALGCAAPAPTALPFGAPAVLAGGEAVARVSSSASGGSELVTAWVAVPPGASGGTLYVRIGTGPAVALPDSAGDASADPETPPKIRFGPDGSLSLLYNVARRFEGQARPLASLRFRRSADTGRTWSGPVVVADDGEFGRYRNDHALAVAPDGTLYVSWLDERVADQISLAFARSLDGGATWSPTAFVDAESPCECCRSGLAVAGDGRVFLAWRKKLPGGIRDIVVASSDDRGATWSPPLRAHADDWEVSGCPDAGPSILADADGTLHLAWWTGKPGGAGVRYVRSPDGGRTWGDPVPLGVAASSAPSHVQLGRLGPDTLVAVWEDGTVPGRPVMAALLSAAGTGLGTRQMLSGPDAGGGFPTLAITAGEVAVSWHQDAGAGAGKRRELIERIARRR